MSPVSVTFSDLQFLNVIYDAQTRTTSLVTVTYEDYPEQVDRESLEVIGTADREGNRPLYCALNLNSEF